MFSCTTELMDKCGKIQISFIVSRKYCFIQLFKIFSLLKNKYDTYEQSACKKSDDIARVELISVFYNYCRKNTVIKFLISF